MVRVALSLAALQVLVACAGGTPSVPPDPGTGHDAGKRLDTGGQWPDLGDPPDAFVRPDGLPDFMPPALEAGPGDSGTQGHDSGTAPLGCPDGYEKNENCSSAKDIGTVKEDASPATRTATLSPVGDVDWYRAKGKEKNHFPCFPGRKQSYVFTVKVDLPAGRKVKLCLTKGSCTGSQTCTDNSTSPARTRLVQSYKVSGTCGADDSTTAYIMVQGIDGKQDCKPYTVSYQYN